MTPFSQTQSHQARTVSIGLLTLLATSVLLPLPGSDGRIAHLPTICPFYIVTGLPCPGCGLTRAFVCLGHGQLLASLHWHPLGWLLYAFTIFYCIRATIAWKQNRPFVLLTPHWRRFVPWAALTLFLGFGLGRIVWLTQHPLLFHDLR